MNLTIIHTENQCLRHLTPLSHLQKQILERLEIGAKLYQNLEMLLKFSTFLPPVTFRGSRCNMFIPKKLIR